MKTAFHNSRTQYGISLIHNNFQNHFLENYDIEFGGDGPENYLTIPLEEQTGKAFEGITVTTWLKMPGRGHGYYLLSYLAGGTVKFELSFTTTLGFDTKVSEFRAAILGNELS